MAALKPSVNPFALLAHDDPDDDTNVAAKANTAVSAPMNINKKQQPESSICKVKAITANTAKKTKKKPPPDASKARPSTAPTAAKKPPQLPAANGKGPAGKQNGAPNATGNGGAFNGSRNQSAARKGGNYNGGYGAPMMKEQQHPSGANVDGAEARRQVKEPAPVPVIPTLGLWLDKSAKRAGNGGAK